MALAARAGTVWVRSGRGVLRAVAGGRATAAAAVAASVAPSTTSAGWATTVHGVRCISSTGVARAGGKVIPFNLPDIGEGIAEVRCTQRLLIERLPIVHPTITPNTNPPRCAGGDPVAVGEGGRPRGAV